MRVLVFVSSDPLRHQISAFLTGTDTEVVEAANDAQARAIANHFPGSINVLLTDRDPDAALAMTESVSQRQPFMAALVISAHPASVIREAAAGPELAFIEKPFAWRELEWRLAERYSYSQRARHRQLLDRSAAIIEDCRRVCADSVAVMGRSRTARASVCGPERLALPIQREPGRELAG